MLRKRYLKKTMNVLYILIGVCIHTGSCQIDLFSFKTTLNHRSPDDNYIIVVVKSIIDCVACIVHVQCRCADFRESRCHLHISAHACDAGTLVTESVWRHISE